MTQTIVPNLDPRYSVIFIEHDEYRKPVRVIEEPVTSWLHETSEESSTITVRPLHPSNHLPGTRHLKRPTGDLVMVSLKHGVISTPAQLIRHFRRAGIEQKDIHLLNPAEWRSWFDELEA